MSSRPSSRATAGEETTASLRSNTAKRPVTKPVAPRLSSASTATKPISTSSARTTPSTTSTLHKPPTRPSTASVAKRPPSSTATATSSVHRARPSIASADASADESKRNGITARPKRMSVAASTTVDRPSASVGRTTTTTPARRTPSTATAATVRPSVRSPTSTTKTPSPTTARTAPALTSRTRPTSSTTTRPVTTLAGKKRLSTVPASPAVRRVVALEDDNDANEAALEAEEPLKRPEEELQDTDDLPGEDEIVGIEKTGDLTNGRAEIINLKEELEESQGQVQELKAHLAEITARMEYFSKSAEEESAKVEEAIQAIRIEHESKIERMMAQHKAQIEDLEASHQRQIEEATVKHEADIATLNEDHCKGMDDISAQLRVLESELDKAKTNIDQNTETVSTPDSEELAEVRKQLETAQGRHLAAKDNAKSKIAKIQEEHAQIVRKLNAQHAEQIADMQKQIDDIQVLKSQNENLTHAKEEHIETENMLQSIKRELESVKMEKESGHEQHLAAIKDLNERLAVSDQLKDEAAVAAESSINKLKIEHDERVKALETKLKAAEREIQSNVDLSEQHYTEAIQKLKDDLEASQLQLTNTLSERESLNTEYESKLKAAEEAAARAETSHSEEVSEMRNKLNAMTTASENKTESLEEELTALQSALEARDNEIKAMQASQDNRMSKLRSEADSANQATVESLKEAHTAELSRAGAEAQAAIRELEELRASNLKQADLIRSEVDVAHKAALDEQASRHQNAVSDLESKLKSIQSQMDDMKRSHEEKLARMKTSHEQKYQELTSQSRTVEDAAERMKASHADELQRSNSRVTDMAGELDAAKFQVQSLKSILQDMEQEFKLKEEESQKELDNKNEDFSQAVVKLSAQSMRIAELETAHRQAVEQAKAAVQAETQTSLDALKQEHDVAFDEMKRGLEAKHQSTLQTLHSEHSHAIEMLTKEVDSRDYNIESLKTEHAQALVDLRSSSQQGSVDALEKLKLEHKTFIDDLTSKHAAQIDEESKQSKNKMDQAKAEYESAIATHQAEVVKLRGEAADTSELDSLNTKLSASQQAFSNLQEEHAATMSSISKEHAQQLSSLEEKIKGLEVEVNKPADTTELENLRANLAEEKVKAAELAQAHTETISTKDHEHTKAIEALQSELTDAKAALSSAVRDSGSMEEAKSLLADAQRTVQELSEQYSIATVDAEHQRLAAESARKELADLKKSLSEASSLPQPVTESSQTTAKAANGSVGNVKPSPKAGLQASKWATADPEPEPSSATDTEQKDLGSDGDLQTGSVAATATDPPKPKSRNVTGQAASIQEQIRQLSEINDEFLNDHQKWARTLNQVDDDGTVTLSESLDQKAHEAENGDEKVQQL